MDDGNDGEHDKGSFLFLVCQASIQSNLSLCRKAAIHQWVAIPHDALINELKKKDIIVIGMPLLSSKLVDHCAHHKAAWEHKLKHMTIGPTLKLASKPKTNQRNTNLTALN